MCARVFLRLQRSCFAALALLALACCDKPKAQHLASGTLVLPSPDQVEQLLGLPEPMVRGESFRRGVVLGPILAPENEEAFKRDYERRLQRAIALGATDLRLVVRWMQPDAQATECAPYDSVHDDQLTWVIEAARRHKLRVVLAPELALESQAERPAHKLAPKSWEQWWWSYRRLALHYARVSATRKVAMFAIGTELTSTEGQTDRWRKLIQEVRKIYKGKLTYVAGAQSFDQVAFWDSLDVVSVAVAQREPRSEAQLLDRLVPLAERLEHSSHTQKLGYELVEASCGGAAPTPGKALLCQRALFQSFSDRPGLRGLFVHAGDHDKGATVPEVVRHWYGRSRG